MLVYGAPFETHQVGVIVGEVTTPLTIAVTLGGVFEVPPEEIVSIAGDRFAFTDGMVLQGRIAAETLAVQTSTGEVMQIPVAQLKMMHREQDTRAVPAPSGDIFELHSGEVLVGKLRMPLTLRLSFGGTVQVPPQELVSFVEGRVTLRDGSLLMGGLTPATLLITTRFGELQVPSVALKAIHAAPAAVVASAPADPASTQAAPTSSVPSGVSSLGGTTFVNSLGMGFVLIPAGEFMMGSDHGDYDEKPVHKVRISQPFYLGKYEVTQGQWQAVMGSNPSRFTK